MQPALEIYRYQRRWLEDKARFAAAMFSRQSGKTFTSTLGIVDDSLDHVVSGQRTRWVILSRGERQAREAMEEGIKRHLHAYQMAFEETQYPIEGAEKALEVVLAGGTRITALPANPDTARGFSANVLLDEFGFHADSRKIWGALFPVVSRAGLRLRVISTPNGKNNKFYEIMSAGEAEWREHGHAQAGVWSLHATNIHQAVAQGLDRNIEELKAGLNDDEIWQQEYELQWLDEASAWLPYELINAAEHDPAGDPSGYEGGSCYLGIDIGTRRDLFVAVVLERVSGLLILRELVARKNASFAEQDAVLDDLMRRYHVVLCQMDQTGMGEKPVEDARRRYGSRVAGVIFSGPSKQRMALAAKQAFESRTVKIPIANAALRSDLHAIKREFSDTGQPRFIADRDSNGHADRAWALFLAIDAATRPPALYAYEPVIALGYRRSLDAPDNDDHRQARWGRLG